MNFLLDENFPSGAWRPLTKIFSIHHFGRVGRDIEAGTEDIDVFPQALEKNYDVFVTADIKQLHIAPERNACRQAGLHWIGVPMNPKSRGKSVAHGQISQLLGAMRLIVNHCENADSPQALLLNPAGHLLDLQSGFPQPL